MQDYSEAAAQDMGWIIDNDAQAEWAVKKIAEAKQNTQRWKEHYAAALAKIKAEDEQTAAFFTEALRQYFENQPKRETKTQSIYDLPDGIKLVMKKRRADYKRDDSTLIDWAIDSAPELVKISTTLDWSALKKRIKRTQDGTLVDSVTGEVLNGITEIETDEAFTIEGGKNNE